MSSCPSFTLTLCVFLSLALLLQVALVTRNGSVQAPVQDVPQERLLLIGQLCRGRCHKAGSVGLHVVIASPWEKADKPWVTVSHRSVSQMVHTNTFWTRCSQIMAQRRLSEGK